MLLAESFLEDIARARDGRRFTLTPLAADALREYHWPGDARELRNVLERATVICNGAVIEADDLSLDPAPALRPCDMTELKSVERLTIERVLRDMQGNISKAARTLGISQTQLYTRLRKHGLSHVVS